MKQRLEGRELVLGHETANRYVFLDPRTGTELGGADEGRGGVDRVLSRQMLGPGRPLNLSVIDTGTGVWLEARRPFSLVAFVRPPATTVTWSQAPLGSIRRVWPLVLRRRYLVSVMGQPGLDLEIDGTILHPWTFPVNKGGRQVASILDKRSGAGREVSTDANTFPLRFEDAGLSAAERRLLVAAAPVVDFDFFETKPRG